MLLFCTVDMENLAHIQHSLGKEVWKAPVSDVLERR